MIDALFPSDHGGLGPEKRSPFFVKSAECNFVTCLKFAAPSSVIRLSSTELCRCAELDQLQFSIVNYSLFQFMCVFGHTQIP